ncbi:MAG: phenylalanine--tRNA ligase subunit beta [Bacillota bacterium]
MKISLNWLNDYLTEKIDNDELVENYNLKSQEVEGLYPLVEASKLTIGYVKTCQAHENADKLSVCQVDVGEKTLQIICGAPNVDKGQKVIVALSGAVLPGDFKIKKAKIRGVESNGMICSLSELGVADFDKKETGIYVLDEDAEIGKDPLKYMGLDDTVLELDLTANRPDLLSMRGVAYDVKAMFDVDIKFNKPEVIREKAEEEINIFTETKDASVYYGQIIKDIKIKESPYWLKSRLLASGIRPVNNVVDITNYVMLEYSQPLHAFDFAKINSNKIIVRKAYKNESIITLDNIKRKLLESDIVITDGEKPIALAGVMGGEETEVSDSTKAILLESAVFDPISVRKTSKRLALKSESSSRFEKGLNYELTLEALNRACELLVKLADARIVGEPSFFNNANKIKQQFTLNLEKLNTVTGYNFDKELVKDILRRLDFDYKLKDNEFIVNVPSRRVNFESYQDVIEEIVRIHGYDKIPITLPTTPTLGKLTEKQQFKRDLRNYFTGLGFFETNTYTLTDKEKATKYDNSKKSLVKIMNPITTDREYLQHSLIPSLIDVLAYNEARKINDVFLFEIGKSYTKENEIELISGLLHGRYNFSLWQKELNYADFYLAKGIIESLFKNLKIYDYKFKVPEKELVNLHPGISTEIYIEDEKIGWLGKIHPEEEKNLEIKDIFAFELEIDKIFESHNKANRNFQEIVKFPSVSRDIAIVVNKEILATELIETINNISNNSLKSIEVFDVYEGDKLSNDKKSIALTLVFENKEKTLETNDVEKMLKRIIKALNEEHNATLRQ